MAAEPKKSSSKSKKPAKQGGSGALIARIALYGAIILVLVGLLLYRGEIAAKNAHAESTTAWTKTLVDLDEKGEPFRRSKLVDMAVGDPEVGEMVNESDEEDAVMHQVFTWKGRFGAHTATVHYAAADDPHVMAVKMK
jgi:hypothetical protein